MNPHTPFRQRLKADWWAAASEIDRWKVASTSTEDFRHICMENGISLSTAYILLKLRNRYGAKPQGGWRALV